MSGQCKIIQGGMGVGVSNWKLSQTVSKAGQLGVVSGTALDQILSRRLQDGDIGGHMRRAMDAFPFPAMAKRVWDTYFIPGGKLEHTPYLLVPLLSKNNPRDLNELCLVSNFVEIFLAHEGHHNPVGINYMEKIQGALLPCIYGSMLAGVDTIVMGAGIPLKIPGVLDRLAQHLPVEYNMHVLGSIEGDDTMMDFDPSDFIEAEVAPLVRPKFYAIVSSNTLAITMVKKANGKVDGLIIETRTAGGHNAPPRGKLQLTSAGEPIYGIRDDIDIAKLCELGVPFWLAGGYGHPEKLREALAQGAAGVQVGTPFEFASESGLRDDYKQGIIAKVIAGKGSVFTDPLASPTGFPFKVAQLEGTYSEAELYDARPRICNLGFLRESYRTDNGEVGYRCPAEPLSLYLSKGGHAEDTIGRKCICNGLLSNVGFPQVLNGNRVELGIITAGDDLDTILQFLPPGQTHYSALDVIAQLQKGYLSVTPESTAA